MKLRRRQFKTAMARTFFAFCYCFACKMWKQNSSHYNWIGDAHWWKYFWQFLLVVKHFLDSPLWENRIAYFWYFVTKIVTVVMGLLFLVWGDANGKFTYVPRYKPGISKLDYTNLSLVKSHRVPGIFLPFSSWWNWPSF